MLQNYPGMRILQHSTQSQNCSIPYFFHHHVCNFRWKPSLSNSLSVPSSIAFSTSLMFVQKIHRIRIIVHCSDFGFDKPKLFIEWWSVLPATDEELRLWLNCSGSGSRRISVFLFYTVKERIPIISIPSEVKYELDSDKVIGGYWESNWKSERDNFLEQRAGVPVFNSSQFRILNLNAGPSFSAQTVA